MFIVKLTYIRSLEAVDALLADHIQFLDTQYAEGIFLASGRRSPRTGGVILARAASREALEKILARDPFALAQVAEYTVEQYELSRCAEGLEALLDREPS